MDVKAEKVTPYISVAKTPAFILLEVCGRSKTQRKTKTMIDPKYFFFLLFYWI